MPASLFFAHFFLFFLNNLEPHEKKNFKKKIKAILHTFFYKLISSRLLLYTPSSIYIFSRARTAHTHALDNTGRADRWDWWEADKKSRTQSGGGSLFFPLSFSSFRLGLRKGEEPSEAPPTAARGHCSSYLYTRHFDIGRLQQHQKVIKISFSGLGFFGDGWIHDSVNPAGFFFEKKIYIRERSG